jgi:hypothetical protein
MSAGTTVGIVIVAVVIIAVVVIAVMATARRRRLQRRFGPEYDRVVGEQQSQLKAEAELAGRERRVQGLDIRPLSSAARASYAVRWQGIQEQFVDLPEDAVAQAQLLVTAVMNERGYPTEGHDQVVADLSVEHAGTLEHYRTAYRISQNAGEGNASTEELRQAMIHYRALFNDLLGSGGSEDAGGEDSGSGGRAAGAAQAASASPASSTDAGPVANPVSRARRS